MSNMSYCRYRNTLIDLLDCVEHLEQDIDRVFEGENDLEERTAMLALIRVCKRIAEDYGDAT